MTTVTIAHAEPRPGRLANGEFQTRGHLVVLADDARRRAVPIWMRGDPGAGDLSHLVESARRPAGEIVTADAPQVLTARLLGAAGASVTEVGIDTTSTDIDELTPQVTVARIRLAGASGTRDVTADLGLGLAIAVATDAPVRLAAALMDRLALPVPGDDLLTPFLDHVPPNAQALPGHGLADWPLVTLPGRRPRYEPRNLDFADGLSRWDLDSGFAARRTRPRITQPPPTASARSCPRPSRVRPAPRPCCRPSLPMTTAAPRSSSAATSAPSR